MYNYIDDVPEITQEYADSWFNYQQEVLPEIYEENDFEQALDEEYTECMQRELMNYNHARMMGWE